MDKLNPVTTITATHEVVNHINDLIERDKAKAVVEEALIEGGHKWHKCPVCGNLLVVEKNFCTECGQRLDFDNIAF